MNTAAGIVLVAIGLTCMVGAWTNKNPYDLARGIVAADRPVRPIDPQ